MDRGQWLAALGLKELGPSYASTTFNYPHQNPHTNEPFPQQLPFPETNLQGTISDEWRGSEVDEGLSDKGQGSKCALWSSTTSFNNDIAWASKVGRHISATICDYYQVWQGNGSYQDHGRQIVPEGG